jgi:hypothetical protein
MKFAYLAAAALAATSMTTVARAQDAAATAAPAATAEVAVGATVTGPDGSAVGTVESVADGVVTVDTGKHKAPLPANAFGAGESGPTITVTKAQLDAMIDEQLAAAATQRDAMLVAGAAVHTADHQPLGTVKSVEGNNVIVEREAGPVNLLREHFAVADNMLMALFSAEQIEAAVAGQAQSQAQTGQ